MASSPPCCAAERAGWRAGERARLERDSAASSPPGLRRQWHYRSKFHRAQGRARLVSQLARIAATLPGRLSLCDLPGDFTTTRIYGSNRSGRCAPPPGLTASRGRKHECDSGDPWAQSVFRIGELEHKCHDHQQMTQLQHNTVPLRHERSIKRSAPVDDGSVFRLYLLHGLPALREHCPSRHTLAINTKTSKHYTQCPLTPYHAGAAPLPCCALAPKGLACHGRARAPRVRAARGRGACRPG